MNLNLNFYIEMKYDQKNMCDFFLKKIVNFISSCPRYNHVHTGYTPSNFYAIFKT
jgi:hypothetical protein